MPSFIDLTNPISPIQTGHLRLGGINPQGCEINANSAYLTLGGRPWLPVMGEIHFSRTDRAAWRAELLKMKAGGIQVVATYLFWNHHEEIQGRYRWDGQRNLREFVQLCGKLGLYSYPRIGPWAHGEARLGGFPDWLTAQCPRTRQDDPLYLEQVQRYFAQIAAQLDGLLWKQGGPIIGIQLENELQDQPEHIRTLKRLALAAGLAAPLYTMTGWGPAQVPEDEVIPVFGGYPDAPWDRYIDTWARASRKHFFFSTIRDDNTIGADLRQALWAPDLSHLERYPFGTCELGGGVQVTYHRRPQIAPQDLSVMALCKLGSGANWLGYYMYHGGTQPLGELGTQQESQDTGYPNDLPVRSYDFQAPLGEAGQVREHYHRLRLLHLFLQDFGSELSTLPTRLPAVQPNSLDDRQTLRWAVRSDKASGYLFINNYQRIESLPAQHQVQFECAGPSGLLRIPAAPLELPTGFSGFWPFGQKIGTAQLRYATAQPLCRLEVDGLPVWVFAACTGLPAEFAFSGGARIAGEPEQTAGSYRLNPGFEHNYRVEVAGKPVAHLIVLTEAEALQCWKFHLWGSEHLVLSPAALLVDEDALHLRSESGSALWFAAYPPPADKLTENTAPLHPETIGGFSRYWLQPRSEIIVPMAARRLRAAEASRTIPIGPAGVAQAPNSADFERAEIWEVIFPAGMPDRTGLSEIRLRIDYRGDAARALCGDELVADDFFFGQPWEIGLNRLAPQVFRQGLTLQFLPLPPGAPIYLPAVSAHAGDLLEVRAIHVLVEYEAVVKPG